MKQSKFPLADVLSILTAFTFGFVCFLGKYFSTLGNTLVSITWGVVISVLLAGTVYIAKSLKQTSHNFKTNFIFEIIVLLLFTSLTIFFSFSSFPHYFNVSDKKTEIQSKLLENIKQAENMFIQYEAHAKLRESLYSRNLNSALVLQDPNALTIFEFRNDIPYQSQVAHKISILKSNLLPSNYSDTITNRGIKEVAQAWLKSAESTIKNWKSIGIVNVVNNVEKNSNDWLSQLKTFAQKQENGEDNNLKFDKILSFDNVKTYFITPSKPNLFSISLSFAAYLLMLLSWFVTKRHTRGTGIFTRAPYEIEL